MYLANLKQHFIDDSFWDYLDTSDEITSNNLYSYVKNFDVSANVKNVIQEIKRSGITQGYACHYRNNNLFPWHAPKFRQYDKAIMYMIKHNFLNHLGGVILENFSELKSFFINMSLYPSEAQYLDIYVICDSYIFEISHHKHIFLYQAEQES